MAIPFICFAKNNSLRRKTANLCTQFDKETLGKLSSSDYLVYQRQLRQEIYRFLRASYKHVRTYISMTYWGFFIFSNEQQNYLSVI